MNKQILKKHQKPRLNFVFRHWSLMLGAAIFFSALLMYWNGNIDAGEFLSVIFNLVPASIFFWLVSGGYTKHGVKWQRQFACLIALLLTSSIFVFGVGASYEKDLMAIWYVLAVAVSLLMTIGFFVSERLKTS